MHINRYICKICAILATKNKQTSWVFYVLEGNKMIFAKTNKCVFRNYEIWFIFKLEYFSNTLIGRKLKQNKKEYNTNE